MSDPNGTVEYGRCPACGYLMLPVLPLSPCGHDDTPVTAPLDEAGVVYSWSTVWGRDISTVMAMVDFLDGGLRVTAPVLDVDGLSIGDRLTITAGRDTPYAFTPLLQPGPTPT